LPSGGWNEFRIILPAPFGRQEIIIAAPQAIGILPANRRARFIDGASARVRVEKAANFFEDMIFLVAKDGSVDRRLCVAAFRLLVRNAKVFCNSQKVAPGYIDSIIAATIRRALVAVEQHSERTRGFFDLPIGYDLTISYDAHPAILGLKEGEE